LKASGQSARNDETLDGDSGNLACGAEPIQQEFLVCAKHVPTFVIGFQTAAHDAETSVTKASAQRTDFYFQRRNKVSFNSQARPSVPRKPKRMLISLEIVPRRELHRLFAANVAGEDSDAEASERQGSFQEGS
jgi:hypothetical protein